MKKLSVIFVCLIFVFNLTSCSGMSVSEKKFNEISNYVIDNIGTLSTEKDLKFFDYESSGLCVGGVDYGYYYSKNNEIVVPDFYSGNELETQSEADGGTYLGEPNSGTDWCFIKKITENWYYYELHWG